VMNFNRYLMASTIFTALAAIIHAVGGEMTSIRSLSDTNVPLNRQVELHAVWHGYTVILAMSAWILFRRAFAGLYAPEVASGLAFFYGSNGLIWFVLILIMGLENVVYTPQWALLLFICLLIILGNRSQRKQYADRKEQSS